MALLLDTSLPGFHFAAAHPRAALIIVHGLAEYADRYREHARSFSERGIACFAFDQRGHGAAAGIRTHIDRFEHFVTDLQTVSAAVRRHAPGIPQFVWGHSMGSIVAIAAVLTEAAAFAGVVTTSNSLEVFRRGPDPLRPPWRWAARVLPRFRIPLRLDPKHISSDLHVQAAYAGDPLIARTASLRLIVEFASWCERCRAGAARIRLPWLVLHGEEDPIAPVQGARLLYEQLGSADKQLVIYPGLRHEVHNEIPLERARFLECVSTWIGARAGGGNRAA